MTSEAQIIESEMLEKSSATITITELFMELLTRFELVTSSLPRKDHLFFLVVTLSLVLYYVEKIVDISAFLLFFIFCLLYLVVTQCKVFLHPRVGFCVGFWQPLTESSPGS